MSKRSKLFLLLATIAAVICLSAGLALTRDAQAVVDTIVNGDFETGNLTGWTIGGLGGHVEILSANDFTPEIPIPEGRWLALLSTGPGEINLDGGPDLDDNEFPDNDTATLAQTFTLLRAQVPATLSFRWSFLSAEVGGYDDFFMVTLNGVRVLAGSVPGTSSFVSPLPDVPPLDGITYAVTSYGLTDGSVFDGGSCGFRSFSYVITTPGSYTLQFVVVDQEDRFFDSGLVIDTVRLTLPSGPAPAPPAPSLEINFGGTTCVFPLTADGIVLETIQGTSADGNLTFTIAEGTIAKDKDGNSLTSLNVTVQTSPPPPPPNANIIGLPYNFGPPGATFNPPATLTWKYDEASIPPGVSEGDLVVAYYDEATGKWVELECEVDTVNNIITAKVPHFTTLAILGYAAPTPAVPTPTPTPVPPTLTPTPTPTPSPGPLPTPVNWWLIGGIIAAVAVIALVIFLLLRRRRAH